MRCVEIDGEPWFVARDVCEALGFKQHPTNGTYAHHLADNRFDEGEKSLQTLPTIVNGREGKRRVVCVSESGLYKLIMRSDKPEAKDFQHWVTAVVLPAIRKDGKRPR
nr:Bro-N domain-containing protein [Devosia sp. MC521]